MYLFRYVLILLLIFLSANSFASEGRSLIISTDVGADDMVAMLYLLKDKHYVIKAIIVNADGLTHCESGLYHVKQLLTITGKEQVPIACGSAKPLSGARHYPKNIRAQTDNVRLDLPVASTIHVMPTGVTLFANALKSSQHKAEILSIGPLTDLAKLFDKYPELKKNVSRIDIMGGAIKVPGNVLAILPTKNKYAEWNIYIDPLAAKKVLASGIPILLMPLDATNQVFLDDKFYNWVEGIKAPMAQLAYKLLANSYSFKLPYAWDGVAAVLISHPEIYIAQNKRIVLVIHKLFHSGEMIEDPHGNEVVVVSSINRGACVKELIEGMIR